MWAIDLDVDRIFWQKHYDTMASAGGSGPCGGGVAAMPGLLPPMNFARRPPGLGTPGVAVPGTPGTIVATPSVTPPAVPPVNPTGRGILGAGGFGAPRPAFALSSDGKLHLMNTSTGDDVVPPLPFLPANSKASSLTVVDNVVYTTTSSDCGESAVWAMDLSGPESKNNANAQENAPVAKFPLSGSVSRLGGLAIGNDNTVYVQAGPVLQALTPKTLKPRQSFVIPATAAKNAATSNPATPVVFAYSGRDLIVSPAPDGSLYLLDSKSLGGEDNRTPLYQTIPLSTTGHIWGGLSSWQDTDGTRWVVAPVWGPVNPELKLKPAYGPEHGEAPHGSIVAFKVEDHDGKAILTPAWVSRDLISPEPPVITSGVVFALSAGKDSTPATLYALDSATGKEMYSTGRQVTAPANLTGVTLANGRVLFTTTDGMIYGFGIYLER